MYIIFALDINFISPIYHIKHVDIQNIYILYNIEDTLWIVNSP